MYLCHVSLIAVILDCVWARYMYCTLYRLLRTPTKLNSNLSIL